MVRVGGKSRHLVLWRVTCEVEENVQNNQTLLTRQLRTLRGPSVFVVRAGRWTELASPRHIATTVAGFPQIRHGEEQILEALDLPEGCGRWSQPCLLYLAKRW